MEPWLFRMARQRGVLFVPGLLLLVLGCIYTFVYSASPEYPKLFERGEILGMFATYALVPCYLLAALGGAWISTTVSVSAIDALLNEAGNRLVNEVNRVHWWWWITVVAGATFGAWGYRLVWTQSWPTLPFYYWTLALGNTLVWASIGYTIAMRIPTSYAFLKLGQTGVKVSIHNTVALKPFARVAFGDLLMVVGALALMPLQSLNADFHWDDYSQGLFVGLPMAALVFFFPLWGVHHALKADKTRKLLEINNLVAQADESEIPGLETLLSHRERIGSASTWPLDVKAVYRIVFYLIIPPLAWVGAALVENWISDLL